MEKTLRLIFRNAEKKAVTISIKDPLDDIDSEEVETVMDLIIETDIFTTSGGDITEKVKAEVVGRTVTVIAEF